MFIDKKHEMLYTHISEVLKKKTFNKYLTSLFVNDTIVNVVVKEEKINSK